MQADTNYAINPWMQTPIPLKKPWSSYEDQLTAKSLAAAMTWTPQEIRDIRPPIPIDLFPPRFGYRQQALGITDVVNIDDAYSRRDFSGKQSGWGSTSYPSLNQY